MYKHLISLKKSTLKNQGDIKMEDSNLVGAPPRSSTGATRYARPASRTFWASTSPPTRWRT